MPTVSLNSAALPMTSAVAGTTYVLDAGESRNLVGTLFDLDSTTGLTFRINGNLHSDNYVMQYGDSFSNAAALALVVGDTGSLVGGKGGVFLSGDGGSVTNDGYIESGDKGRAIQLNGDHTEVVNRGAIVTSGYVAEAVFFYGSDYHLANSGIIKGTIGIKTSNDAGDTGLIVNSGHIYSAGSFAITLDDANETLRNSGHIHGSVRLGDGDDRFIDRGGRVDGDVSGGDGDDLYVLRSAIRVSETTGDGFDTVKSSASFTLAHSIEEGWLTGKANLSMTGTSNGDLLYGNKGSNRITGDMGADWITGGAGNDRLTGGDADGSAGDLGDFFVFKAHCGADVITDFQDGMDRINLQSYTGIDGFADLSGHIKQQGDDLLIRFADGDQLILRDMDKANLSDADFQF